MQPAPPQVAASAPDRPPEELAPELQAATVIRLQQLLAARQSTVVHEIATHISAAAGVSETSSMALAAFRRPALASSRPRTVRLRTDAACPGAQSARWR